MMTVVNHKTNDIELGNLRAPLEHAQLKTCRIERIFGVIGFPTQRGTDNVLDSLEEQNAEDDWPKRKIKECATFPSS